MDDRQLKLGRDGWPTNGALREMDDLLEREREREREMGCRCFMFGAVDSRKKTKNKIK
jgi:hypothetical protein